ncbi:hypothetical protein A3B18_02980 [Candidatus Giovannonibacteria bacterium RIFCSPLOWO2_01_FULL_46_13]|uniref:Uncharacterized protein n=1 Tax=Candidatus Giovannonibacteria bacterium RIFCSPLOWO2_01_FULL_46_13 TaxID=1798352 RepID=A0A1F5X322_9BACT|nr:MAG: hypothetical protein A3B18_02980 [Candidatus Giovannonibacteria bacterium RIFCSPLOWO2_01_FULL_46_13]
MNEAALPLWIVLGAVLGYTLWRHFEPYAEKIWHLIVFFVPICLAFVLFVFYILSWYPGLNFILAALGMIAVLLIESRTGKIFQSW